MAGRQKLIFAVFLLVCFFLVTASTHAAETGIIPHGQQTSFWKRLGTRFWRVTGSKDFQELYAKSKRTLIRLLIMLMDAVYVANNNCWSASDVIVSLSTLVKSSLRSYLNPDPVCMQLYLCEAIQDCGRETPSCIIVCDLGEYMVRQLLAKRTDTPIEVFQEASMAGRNGENCANIYSGCNEI